jgi:hypothetical protein
MRFVLLLFLLFSGAAWASSPAALCAGECGSQSNPAACMIRCRAAQDFLQQQRQAMSHSGMPRPAAQRVVAGPVSQPTRGQRWGAIYAALPPTAAVGTNEGALSRDIVHARAEGSCRAQARGDCRLLTEFSSGCGAAAQATRLIGVVQTHDPSVNRVTFIAGATAPTRAEAERAALTQCASRDRSATCRVVAALCVGS